jgi:hypothetical protein
MPVVYPNILTSNPAEYTVSMNTAFTQMATSLAKFGEVFVRFDTGPLLKLGPASEFDEDIAEMRQIDGSHPLE